MAAREQPVVCGRCGQKANEPPGFKLEEYQNLEAVFVDDAVIIGNQLPQKLVCRNCGKAVAVPRGSITVRKAG